MDDVAILRGIEEACQSTFNNPGIRLLACSTAADVAGWDSLTHILLIRTIEKSFKIKIAVREASRLENVGKLVTLIQGKVA